MEQPTEDLEIVAGSEWSEPTSSRVAGWELEHEADDLWRRVDFQRRRLYRNRALVLSAELKSSTIDRWTRTRVAALERQVSQLLEEVSRLRILLEEGSGKTTQDSALEWISENKETLEAHAGMYVAFSPTRGIMATASSMKELYSSLELREDIHIHYVSEPLACEDE